MERGCEVSGLIPKGKYRKSRETRGRFNMGTLIQPCPTEAKNRELFEHGE